MEESYQESRRTLWAGIMSDWENSNQSIVAFCKKHGYSKGNFFRWKKRFEEEGTLQKTDHMAMRRSEWEKIISDWAASGLSVTAYCRLHGYASTTFANWRNRLQDSPVESNNFVSVTFSAPETRSLRIVLGDDIEVTFNKKTDIHYLGKVIKALQSVC